MDANQSLDRQVPHFPGFLFFIPITSLLTLVYGPTALEHAYEHSVLKNPKWPSWKSLDKWIFSPTARYPARPSSVASIDALAEETLTLDFLSDVDCIWQAELEWKGFLRAQIFQDQRSITYWTDWLALDKTLGCKLLPACADIGEKVRLIAFSALAKKLGCAGSVSRMAGYDWNDNEPGQLNAPLFLHNRIADTFAVVVRVCAWAVAEISVRDWSAIVEAGLENEILLNTLIPRFDEHAGQWSRPIAEQLCNLAADAGYQGEGRASAFLGEILAGEYSDIPDKQRALRRWEEAHPGKPRDSVLATLLEAVEPLLKEHGGLWSNVSAQDKKFRFAWLNVVLLREMVNLNLPGRHIQEVFDAYEDEFRKARALLGKPLL